MTNDEFYTESGLLAVWLVDNVREEAYKYYLLPLDTPEEEAAAADAGVLYYARGGMPTAMMPA